MDLHDGEQILVSARPSWRSALGTYLLGDLLAAAVAAVLIFLGEVLLGIVAGVAVIIVVTVVGLLMRIGTRYVVTNERIIVRKGILSRAENRCSLSRVANVSTSQSVAERILGIGTVEFETSGDDPDIRFVAISDPAEIVREVEAATR